MLAGSEPFPNAIKAAVEDDAPRLVFADWLAEHGLEERGELIRRMVQMRRWSLKCSLNDNRPDQWGILGRPSTNGRGNAARARRSLPDPSSLRRTETIVALLRRGFIESITLAAADWLANGDCILAEHPVREVELTTFPNSPECWTGIAPNPDDLTTFTTERWPRVLFHLPKPRPVSRQQLYAAMGISVPGGGAVATWTFPRPAGE